MNYYGIHITYGNGDSDGYTIPIAIKDGDEEAAIQKAVKKSLFEAQEDINNIDYIEEISKKRI
jgi:hypothetical protein